MATKPERIVLTYDDLLDLPEDRNRYELYGGEIEVTAAPAPSHQVAVLNLGTMLHRHTRERDLGLVLVAPVDVKFNDVDVVEPDLLFIAKARVEIIGDRFIAGRPDLVVEVLSPTTATRDRRVKRALYARNGVPHYWLIDPGERTAEALGLVGDRYRLLVRAQGDGTFAAPPFPELVIPLAELWTF